MSDPKAIILAYQEAHNNQDVDRALSLFAPNIRFEMAGIWVREGLEQQRELEEWDAALSSKLVFDNFKKRGGRTECTAIETNAWLKMAGIGTVTYESVLFEFDGDQIIRIRAKLAPKSEMAMDKAMNGVVRWALDHKLSKIEEIIPRGLFHYGKQQAEDWLVMLNDWQQQAVESED